MFARIMRKGVIGRQAADIWSVKRAAADSVERAGGHAFQTCTSHAGQGCVLGTRVFVPEESKPQVLEAMAAAVANVKIGPANDPATVLGPVISASNVLLAIVWLSVTVLGFRAGREYRLTEHRRWMIRSVVLTLSIITNRVWVVIWVLALSPQLATTIGGNETLMVQTIAGLSGWLGWVLPLVAVELWLDTRAARTTAVASTLVPS